jgi:hypothetical protein
MYSGKNAVPPGGGGIVAIIIKSKGLISDLLRDAIFKGFTKFKQNVL